jgi:hypothetical protein
LAFAACGKALDSGLVFPLERILGLFGLFLPRVVFLFCVWKPFYRPPDTLRPCWASDSIGISLLMRIGFCALMLNFQNQSTRSSPRSFTWRAWRSNFDQPIYHCILYTENYKN